MNIFAITFGDERTASTRYRVLQYRRLFEQNGHKLTVVPKNSLGFRHLFAMARADVVWVQKSLLPRLWLHFIRKNAKRLVFDWDDAFWTTPEGPRGNFAQRRVERRLAAWLTQSDAIVSANSYLDDYARPFNPITHKLPMAMDLRACRPSKGRPEHPILVWVGAPGNLPYLKHCEEAIKIFLEKHPQAVFKVLCGKPPALSFDYEYVPWKPGAEADFLAEATVGLLPLPEADPFALGKSPIKALQYMACGLPVVGNMQEGGPGDIAQRGGCLSVRNHTHDWLQAFESLLDPEFYAQTHREALQNIRDNHDIERLFPKLIKILSGN